MSQTTLDKRRDFYAENSFVTGAMSEGLQEILNSEPNRIPVRVLEEAEFILREASRVANQESEDHSIDSLGLYDMILNEMCEKPLGVGPYRYAENMIVYADLIENLKEAKYFDADKREIYGQIQKIFSNISEKTEFAHSHPVW